MIKGGMLAVLDLLEVLVQVHLRVKQAVLIDVLLVLDLLLVAELGHGLLVLLVELGHGGLVLLLSLDLFRLSALHHGLVVLAEVAVQIALRLGDELVHLALVLALHGLGLLQLGLVLGQLGLFLLLGVDAVALQTVHAALDLDHLVGAVLAQGVNLCLDAADILVDRLAELLFLFRRENLCVFRCHMQFLPL